MRSTWRTNGVLLKNNSASAVENEGINIEPTNKLKITKWWVPKFKRLSWLLEFYWSSMVYASVMDWIFFSRLKGRTIRKVVGGGGAWGKKTKKLMQGKTQGKKFMHKMGLILTLNQNCNSSRKVFQNAPNGIRACPDFQFFFLGEDAPGLPIRKWASRPS